MHFFWILSKKGKKKKIEKNVCFFRSYPLSPHLNKIKAFKKEFNNKELGIFHAARIMDTSTARSAIEEGILDMVGMTRAHIFEKIRGNY